MAIRWSTDERRAQTRVASARAGVLPYVGDGKNETCTMFHGIPHGKIGHVTPQLEPAGHGADCEQAFRARYDGSRDGPMTHVVYRAGARTAS